MSEKGGGGGGGGGHYQPHHLTLTQADQDIIKSFLSSVPAGFPLSPGAALAELSSFSPLSPSLPASSYHFSLSPARVQDPPSPSPRHQRCGVQSPKRSQRSSVRAGSAHSRAVSPELSRESCWSPAPHSSQHHLGSVHLLEDNIAESVYKRDISAVVDSSAEYFKRPRLSHSPTQSSSPRHNIDWPIGSFSPRRPPYSLNPPNPYSPVNPPPPYSPRRLVNVNSYSPPSDHRYYDQLQLPASPSQQTHPPSPTRNLDLSPTSQVLDLDIHQSYQDGSLRKKDKPLTKSVKKKLGLVKSKLKSKSKHKRSPAPAAAAVVSAVPKVCDERNPPSGLETDLSQVEARLAVGCSCDLKCFSDLEPEFVWRHRCNIAELSKGEHDMYLMGIMMASLANPRATSKHKERQRNRNKYIFQGKETCQEAFLYLENVTVYQLKSIRRHVIENDVVTRVHKNTGKKPHNVLELDHYQLTHRFVQDLLEKETSGLGSGSNRKKTFLADLTCKKLHSRYLQYFSHLDLGLGSKTMAYSTFRNFVHQRFPQLKFTSREAVVHNVEKPNMSINISASNINEIDDTVFSINTDTDPY